MITKGRVPARGHYADLRAQIDKNQPVKLLIFVRRVRDMHYTYDIEYYAEDTIATFECVHIVCETASNTQQSLRN